MNSFARFYARVAVAHFFSYVIVGAVSYMLIMRYCLPSVPPDVGLRAITSVQVQTWLWPAQFVRALVLAAVFYPLRDTLLRAGRFAALLVAGMMVGLGCLSSGICWSGWKPPPRGRNFRHSLRAILEAKCLFKTGSTPMAPSFAHPLMEL